MPKFIASMETYPFTQQGGTKDYSGKCDFIVKKLNFCGFYLINQLLNLFKKSL